MVYAAGEFTKVDGTAASGFAQFDDPVAPAPPLAGSRPMPSGSGPAAPQPGLVPGLGARRATIRRLRIGARLDRVEAVVRCPGTAACTGRIALTARAGGAIASAAGSTRFALGNRAFSVAAGRTATLRVRTSRTGRRRLARVQATVVTHQGRGDEVVVGARVTAAGIPSTQATRRARLPFAAAWITGPPRWRTRHIRVAAHCAAWPRRGGCPAILTLARGGGTTQRVVTLPGGRPQSIALALPRGTGPIRVTVGARQPSGRTRRTQSIRL
jgi:hypothetical protein